jgi:hypothetical protein
MAMAPTSAARGFPPAVQVEGVLAGRSLSDPENQGLAKVPGTGRALVLALVRAKARSAPDTPEASVHPRDSRLASRLLIGWGMAGMAIA